MSANIQVLTDRYSYYPNNLGMFYPGVYTADPDPIPEIASAYQSLTSGGERVPLSYNPAAKLYAFGAENQTLLAASAPGCNTGCLSTKPDPRNKVVKPLYQQHVYSSDLKILPTSGNVIGMYGNAQNAGCQALSAAFRAAGPNQRVCASRFM